MNSYDSALVVARSLVTTNLAGATKIQKIGSWDEGEKVIEQKLNGHIGKCRHYETGSRGRRVGTLVRDVDNVVDRNQQCRLNVDMENYVINGQPRRGCRDQKVQRRYT